MEDLSFDNPEALVKAVEEEKKSTTPPSFKPKNNFNGDKQFQKRKNLWTDSDIRPVPLSSLKFEKGDKSYSIIYNDRGQAIPSDIVFKMTSLVKILNKNGYTFRCWFNGNDTVGSQLTDKELTKPDTLKVEWYLPSKFYNSNIEQPISLTNNELSFQVAKSFHRNYDKLHGFVRAICARDIELLLGSNLRKPLKFLIIYSSCGSEALSDKPNYESLGQLSFILRLAKETLIPVFNLKNPDAIDRLKKFLGVAPSTPAATQPVTQQEQPQPQPVEEVVVREVTTVATVEENQTPHVENKTIEVVEDDILL